MLTHKQIWAAIDSLAAHYGHSPSGLAKLSGLDPTTFNKSKRIQENGKTRWPSTESLAKILGATGASVEEFVGFLSKNPSPRPVRRSTIPLIGFAQAGNAGYFDDGGFPAGRGWDEISAPELQDEHAYALEISGESMLPAYRPGDLIIVSPQAGARRGDRVVVKTVQGEVMAKVLLRKSAKKVELGSLNPQFPDRSLDMAQIAWIARIIWASQ